MSTQEQVKSLSNITQNVEATASAPVHDVLYEALFRAKGVIGELHQVITVTLVMQGSGSGSLRRFAWFKNKRKIARLQRNLNDARDSLLAALSTTLLSDHLSIQGKDCNS